MDFKPDFLTSFSLFPLLRFQFVCFAVILNSAILRKVYLLSSKSIFSLHFLLTLVSGTTVTLCSCLFFFSVLHTPYHMPRQVLTHFLKKWLSLSSYDVFCCLSTLPTTTQVLYSPFKGQPSYEDSFSDLSRFLRFSLLSNFKTSSNPCYKSYQYCQLSIQ